MSWTESSRGGDVSPEELRSALAKLLTWSEAAGAPEVRLVEERDQDGFVERLIEYPNAEGEIVRAFLLMPVQPGPLPGVVVNHQHNGQRHLGKSEVAGRAGDPVQALGPILAREGFVVLAPDAVCFEDRRRGASGVEPDPRDERQHYDEMAYRLVQGSLLISVVVNDAALALSVLRAVDRVDPGRVGMLGHSMGGHTTLFAAALDRRVQFACISGAACGYRARIDAGVGIEYAQVIPGIVDLLDFDGLLGLIAPRPALIISGYADPYSFDAPDVVRRARAQYNLYDAGGALTHAHYDGGHSLTPERIETMLTWLHAATSSSNA